MLYLHKNVFLQLLILKSKDKPIAKFEIDQGIWIQLPYKNCTISSQQWFDVEYSKIEHYVYNNIVYKTTLQTTLIY